MLPSKFAEVKDSQEGMSRLMTVAFFLQRLCELHLGLFILPDQGLHALATHSHALTLAHVPATNADMEWFLLFSRFVAGQTSKLEELALILPSWLHIVAQSRGVDISVSHDQDRVLQESVLEELLFAKGVLLGRAFHTSIYFRNEK